MKNLLAGLAILGKYNADADVCAEHDCIYVNITAEHISEEDKEALNALSGWHYSEDADSWAMFT